MRRLGSIPVAAAAGLCLLTFGSAHAGFVPITVPDAAYLTSTTRINPAPAGLATSISDSTLTISFMAGGSPAFRSVVQIPTGWPAWAVAPMTESVLDPSDYSPPVPTIPPFTAYPPNVVKSLMGGQTELTLLLNGAELTTFGLEVEPDDIASNDPHNITVTFFDDNANTSFEIEQAVIGNADPDNPSSPRGARLFAVNATAGTVITRVMISSAVDFGFANIRYSGEGPIVPEPSTWAMLLGTGAIGLVCYARRRRPGRR